MDPIHRAVIERQQQNAFVNKLKSPVSNSTLTKISNNISKRLSKLVKTSECHEKQTTGIKVTSFRRVGGYKDYLDSRVPEVFANKLA
jgi:hypothetical protein